MEYNSCELIILPKRYFYTRFTFGVQKDSPYLELINYHLLKMAERGVSAQISKTYEPHTQACPDYTGTALGFHSLIFPFLVIVWRFDKLGDRCVGICFQRNKETR